MSSKWQSKVEKGQREIWDQKNLARTNGQKKTQNYTSVTPPPQNTIKMRWGLGTVQTFKAQSYYDIVYTDEIKQSIKLKNNIFVIDLDDTIAIPGTRRVFWTTEPQNLRAMEAAIEFDEFDEEIWKIIHTKYLKSLMASFSRSKILFVTARTGTKICRENTEKWLMTHIGRKNCQYELIMRDVKDTRPDWITKPELVAKHLKGVEDWEIVEAFDDNPKVLDAYHEMFNTKCHIVEKVGTSRVYKEKIDEVQVPEAAAS